MTRDGWRIQTKLGQVRFRPEKFGSPSGESTGQTRAFETLCELARTGEPGTQTMKEMYRALLGDIGGPSDGTVAAHEWIHDHIEQRLRQAILDGRLVCEHDSAVTTAESMGVTGKAAREEPAPEPAPPPRRAAPAPRPERKPEPEPVADPTLDFVALELVDSDGNPLADEAYELLLPTGEKRRGTLDAQGKAHITGIPNGKCELAFPNFDAGDWKLVG